MPVLLPLPAMSDEAIARLEECKKLKKSSIIHFPIIHYLKSVVPFFPGCFFFSFTTRYIIITFFAETIA